MKLNLSAGLNMFGRIVTLVVFFSNAIAFNKSKSSLLK